MFHCLVVQLFVEGWHTSSIIYLDVYNVFGTPLAVSTVAVGVEKHVAISISVGRMEVWKIKVYLSVCLSVCDGRSDNVIGCILRLIYCHNGLSFIVSTILHRVFGFQMECTLVHLIQYEVRFYFSYGMLQSMPLFRNSWIGSHNKVIDNDLFPMTAGTNERGTFQQILLP